MPPSLTQQYLQFLTLVQSICVAYTNLLNERIFSLSLRWKPNLGQLYRTVYFKQEHLGWKED